LLDINDVSNENDVIDQPAGVVAIKNPEGKIIFSK